MISFAFVFFLVRSTTILPGDLSLDCDTVTFRTVEPDANGRGKMELVGVGVAFARVPFAALAFTILAVSSLRLNGLEPSPSEQCFAHPFWQGRNAVSSREQL